MSLQQIQCQLKTKEQTFLILHMKGYEALSKPFIFNLTFRAQKEFDEDQLINQSASLCFLNDQKVSRKITGIIIKTKTRFSDKEKTIGIIFTSPLTRLKNFCGGEVFLQKTVVDITNDLLINKAGFLSHQIKCKLSAHYPIKPMIIHVPNETDFHFFQRLLSLAGIFYHFENDAIILTDSNTHLPKIDNQLDHHNIFNVELNNKKVSNSFSVRNTNEHAHNSVKVTKNKKPINFDIFGSDTINNEEAKKIAELYVRRARIESFSLKAKTHHTNIFPGMTIKINLDHLNQQGYLLTEIHHKAIFTANNNQSTYYNTLSAIDKTTHFQSAMPKQPSIPICFSGTVESTGNVALLDEEGGYRIRYDFDRSDKPLAQASIPLRKLEFYGAPINNDSVGSHFPLKNGANILIGCFNNNPNKPLILGSHATADQPSNVTNKNPKQNCFISSQNRLIMDDNNQTPNITLETSNQTNQLILKNRAEITAKNGDINLYAKENCLIKANDLNEIIDESCHHHVDNNYHTKTEKGNLHLTAKNKIDFNSDEKTTLQSNKRICFNANHDMNLQTGGTLNLTGNALSFESQKGHMIIESNKEIKINSTSSIHLSCKNAGIVLHPDGRITVYGQTITGNIVYSGAVNRQDTPMKFPDIDTSIL